MRIEDNITYIGNPEDLIYLTRPLFPVNMRLFKFSETYRELIHHCCDVIRIFALAPFADYGKPRGMSGANAGIPFNIVGIVINRGKENESCKILINPIWYYRSKETRVVSSNCGSIRLAVPIKVRRHAVVSVDYFEENGDPKHETFTKATSGFTVQHEVDHNNGILITDRKDIREN